MHRNMVIYFDRSSSRPITSRRGVDFLVRLIFFVGINKAMIFCTRPSLLLSVCTSRQANLFFAKTLHTRGSCSRRSFSFQSKVWLFMLLAA